MTGRYDSCPACGSCQVIPYAVLAGGSEEYGCQCLACQVMWPVLTYPARDEAEPVAPERDPAA